MVKVKGDSEMKGQLMILGKNGDNYLDEPDSQLQLYKSHLLRLFFSSFYLHIHDYDHEHEQHQHYDHQFGFLSSLSVNTF